MTKQQRVTDGQIPDNSRLVTISFTLPAWVVARREVSLEAAQDDFGRSPRH